MKGDRTNIVVNTTFNAVHHWPECNVPGMSYLRSPHRHVFHVRVTVPVRHDDRDVEFIDFKKNVDRLLANYNDKDIGRLSCEDICLVILTQFPEINYVRVLEDNENGAEKYREE